MNLYAFTLVATCAAMGGVTINWRQLARFAAISLLLVMGTIGFARWGLSMMISKQDAQLATLTSIELSPQVPTEVRQQAPKNLTALSHSGQSTLKRILERGTLRVGYREDALPFAFLDAEGTLVGYDIQLFHLLAMELNVTLEFIPWEYNTLVQQLNAGHFDLVAGGLIINTERLTNIAFSDSYMNVTVGLLVDDYQRDKKTEGTIDRLYDAWILGKVDTQKKPRWSVIRNVLHWID